MTSKIFEISLISMILSSIVLAIFSVLYCWRRYNPRYLRSFLIYAVVNMGENVLTLFVRSLVAPAQNLYTLFEMLYFSYFLGEISAQKKPRYTVWLFGVAYAALYIFFAIKKDLTKAIGLLVVIESFLLCIGCMLYFRELMLKPVIIELSREPSLWMVIGILFYFAMVIPSIFISTFFSFKSERALAQATYSINNYAQVINTVLFLKGMTCSRKRSSELPYGSSS